MRAVSANAEDVTPSFLAEALVRHPAAVRRPIGRKRVDESMRVGQAKEPLAVWTDGEQVEGACISLEDDTSVFSAKGRRCQRCDD